MTSVYLTPRVQTVLPRIVYVIHLEQPLSPYHTSQHYIGSCRLGHFAERLAEHRSGIRTMHTDKEGRVRWTGAARYLQVAVERGIRFWPVRAFIDETGTWYGGEYLLKARKNTPKLCPACVPEPWTDIAPVYLREIEVEEALEMQSTTRAMRARKLAARAAEALGVDIHTGVMPEAFGVALSTN